MSKTKNLSLAFLLIASTLTLAAPADAHICAAYDGCDAGACKEGEDHEHTDYNWVGEDEYCKSEKNSDDDDDCEILGVGAPEILCEGPDLVRPF